jgi:hypothetical protein
MTDHPGNDYYVNIISHTIQRQSNPVLAASLKATGWDGPYTWAQAQTAIKEGGLAGAPHAVAKAAGDATGVNQIKSVTDFLSRLAEGNTWIRVAEVALGLMLIAVGVAKLTDAIPVATKIAKTLA